MSDLSWFKFTGQRSRTPITPTFSSSASERNNSLEAAEEQTARRELSSKMSSYPSLNSPREPPTPSNASFVVNNQDNVWHNPSLDQMVEALQVTMMTNGVLTPIPVDQNAYVLRLIEGYHRIQDNLDVANSACKKAKEARDRIMEDFTTVSDEWIRREKQWKAEVKRLEVLLSRTSRDGLETVTVARANSVVDRSDPNPHEFVTRLKQLRQAVSNESQDEYRMDEGSVFFGPTPSASAALRSLEQIEARGQSTRSAPLPPILDNNNDFIVSEKIRRQDAAAAAAAVPIGRRRQDNPPATTSFFPGDGESDSTSTSSNSDTEGLQRRRLGADGYDSDSMNRVANRSEMSADRISSRFSFVAGDDNFSVPPCQERMDSEEAARFFVERAQSRQTDDYIDQSLSHPLERLVMIDSPADRSPLSTSAKNGDQGDPGVTSHDSTSSRNTVIRYGSSRSIGSLPEDRVEHTTTQSPCNQAIRQNSAQIAAARAVARNKRQ